MIKLWLAPADFTEANVTSLACDLRRKYESRDFLFVWMLDDERAAKQYNNLTEENGLEVQHSLRVNLAVEKKKGSEISSFVWFPDRNDREHAVEVTIH